MSQETFGTETETFDRIPLKERMAFQILLMQLMLGEKPKYKTDKEWNEEEMKWIEIYAKIVSEIIDNIKNKEIRDLLMKREYKEASNIVMEMLEKEKIEMKV